jgi:transcriptional regulator GlxA family with amidase domain
MKRRRFLSTTAASGFILAASNCASATSGDSKSAASPASGNVGSITPPAKGTIPVAFVISRGATVIDFCGPWEVFQDVHVPSRGATMDEQMPFQLYTVSKTTDPITASAGLKIIPDYTFANAPQPKVIVIPAQGGADEATHEWLRKVLPTADVTMSVCTGAFVLGKAGLLKGRSATTHHDFFDMFEKAFPDVSLKRGLRFVEGDKISTAGGLTSGIDLALRVVDRYFGREVAQKTAEYMEYQSKGWIA